MADAPPALFLIPKFRRKGPLSQPITRKLAGRQSSPISEKEAASRHSCHVRWGLWFTEIRDAVQTIKILLPPPSTHPYKAVVLQNDLALQGLGLGFCQSHRNHDILGQHG